MGILRGIFALVVMVGLVLLGSGEDDDEDDELFDDDEDY